MRIDNKSKLKMVKEHVYEGITLRELVSTYKLDISTIKYLVELYRRHGEKIFLKREIVTRYDREQKLKAIRRVILNKEVQRQVALDIGLIDPSILRDWIKMYKKGGEEAIRTTYGRKSYELSKDKIKRLEDKKIKDRLEYLEAENEYLKKLYSLSLKRGKTSKKKLD